MNWTKLRKFGAFLIFTSIIYVPLARAVAEEILKNPITITFKDETGQVIDEDKLLNIAWVVINTKPIHDLTQAGNPEVSVDVIVRATTYEVTIDQADFYWDDGIWNLDQLKADIASGDFMPGLVEEPQQ